MNSDDKGHVHKPDSEKGRKLCRLDNGVYRCRHCNIIIFKKTNVKNTVIAALYYLSLFTWLVLCRGAMDFVTECIYILDIERAYSIAIILLAVTAVLIIFALLWLVIRWSFIQSYEYESAESSISEQEYKDSSL